MEASSAGPDGEPMEPDQDLEVDTTIQDDLKRSDEMAMVLSPRKVAFRGLPANALPLPIEARLCLDCVATYAL